MEQLTPNDNKSAFCDLVISGSGVRMIAQVGAIKRLEEAGYGFRRIAGTSGGAIVGSLLAAGYTADELYKIITSLDWHKIRDRKLFSPVSLYRGDYIENLIKTLLDKKHVRDFQSVPNLHIVASDITNAQELVFSAATPDIPVYKAVRCSMSIPLIFAYQTYKNACVVDGGVQANYPISLFDDDPTYPTIGVKMVDKSANDPNPIYNGWNILLYHWTRVKAIVVTLWRQQDNIHVEDVDWDTRTIKIFATIASTNFDLTPAQVESLYALGYQSADQFLQVYHPALALASSIAVPVLDPLPELPPFDSAPPSTGQTPL